MRYVIAYDISCDRRRARIATVLEGHGRRVQYSIFEADLSGRELGDVVAALEELAEPATDRIRLYRLCAACASAVESIGAPVLALDPDVWIL